MHIRRLLALAVFVAAVLAATAVGPAVAHAAGTTFRASNAFDGGQTNNHSARFGGGTAISADGRYVAFEAEASNLVPGDTNGDEDVFVYDRVLGTTELADVSSTGEQANSFANAPYISADGRFVTFQSGASNLVAGDTNNSIDDFIHDRLTGITERVSVSSTGEEGNSFAAGNYLSVSDDGRYVAFESFADNLVPNDTNNASDIFLRDRLAGTTTRISVTSSGAEANGASELPFISGDGSKVVFDSYATNFVADDANGSGRDVFVHDVATGATTLESVSSAGVQGAPDESVQATISADGRFITFHSAASNLVPGDTNGVSDGFVRDLQTGTTEGVNVSPAGAWGNQVSFTSLTHGLSADGRYVVFYSEASNLVPGDTNNMGDVFVRDRVTGAVQRVSVSSSGVQANAPPQATYVISRDGEWVAFGTDATNLLDDGSDTNGFADLYMHQVVWSGDVTPPAVGMPSLSVNPKAVGQTTTLSASASDGESGVVGGEYFLGADPGVGNGTPMAFDGGKLSATIGSSLAPGVYAVQVRARDAADNWSAPAQVFLVVYDPTGGYATGGGWIVPGGATSEAGDLLPAIDGTSKANFGFVVKYATGSSTVPGGNLEFHYSVAKFHLKSTAYDWLVVTNQNWAKFQGLAKIDGTSALYPFQVDARDGDANGGRQTDRFVIRVYAPGANPNTAEPIYKASGDVTGGQVKIQK